ncbi:MAG: hypothetical protein H0U70_10185 [Tatlockia sp.]|nr:hypothetical protein [Tatlockia sp.]
MNNEKQSSKDSSTSSEHKSTQSKGAQSKSSSHKPEDNLSHEDRVKGGENSHKSK